MIYLQLLSNTILKHFEGTGLGHCARVDFLSRPEASEICEIASHQEPTISFRILVGYSEIDASPFNITTDQAIEIRNRKQERLCLFVPSDLVDAAVSSLSNSFAIIDSRNLQERVLKQLEHELPKPADAIRKAVYRQLRGNLRVSSKQKLDFVQALTQHAKEATLDQAGSELWRVGLISDTRPDFSQHLEHNRDVVISLAHPLKLHANASERISQTRVAQETAIALNSFFRNRSMNQVQDWSHALLEEGITFDQWSFPEQQKSDLSAVKINPFTDGNGALLRGTKLAQPDGAGGSLIAQYGPKQMISVKWKTDPLNPSNIDRWRVELVPQTDNEEFDFDFPSRDVTSDKRTANLKLDFEPEEEFDCSFKIRVLPLDASGRPLFDENDPQFLSQEFFLMREISHVEQSTSRPKQLPITTLALGRIESLLDSKEASLSESEPLWSSHDLDVFSIRLNERTILSISLSPALRELEEQIITDPRSGGRYLIETSDITALPISHWSLLTNLYERSEEWQPFWRARENFFQRLKKAKPRHLIEVADWNEELADSAFRYAHAYRELLEALQKSDDRIALGHALSLDSVLVRVAGRSNKAEESLLILPTHPLRAMWYASYSQLLQAWEQGLAKYKPIERRQQLDLSAVRLLAPANTPAFILHPDAEQPFAFVQNLHFFFGIALSPHVHEPQRRVNEIATIVGLPSSTSQPGDLQPSRLASYFESFHQLHPYIDTLVTTAVNIDQGSLLTQSLQLMIDRLAAKSDENELAELPKLEIKAFTEGNPSSNMPGALQLRQTLNERAKNNRPHMLQPIVTTSIEDISALADHQEADAHIALVADNTHPRLVTLPIDENASESVGSFALYGLVTRFVSRFKSEYEQYHWSYLIEPSGSARGDTHPAGPRYATTLIETHSTLLRAVGLLIGQEPGYPALQMTIDARQRKLLARLHQMSNWVITLDRFFAIDYYDSPHNEELAYLAERYLIDYTPDFSDGLGHRLVVTTAWREELEVLLKHALSELKLNNGEEDIQRLLYYLKMVSGRLALQMSASPHSSSEAVVLGLVSALLEREKRLEQTVLIPLDAAPQLFASNLGDQQAPNEQFCDMMLVSLKRNIVDTTFIKIRLRRGNLPLENTAQMMYHQMQRSEEAIRKRFFASERVDGSLQRSYFANVLRFYFERARRYELFDKESEASFNEHLARLEKAGLEFRASFEGIIVDLNSDENRQFSYQSAKMRQISLQQLQAGSGVLASDEEGHEGKPEQSAFDLVKQVGESPIQPLGASSQAVAQTESIPQAPIATQSSNEVAVVLGDTPQKEVVWKPSVKGSPHLFIIGIPGQGKSWTTTRILTQLGMQGVPSLVLDFHGQFAEPGGDVERQIKPTILDASQGLPFSPFAFKPEQGSVRDVSYAIAEIMAYVGGLGDMQRDVLYQAIQQAYRLRGFEALEPNATLPDFPSTHDVLQALEEVERNSSSKNIVARCRPILEMDLFKPSGLNQNLLDHVRSGLIIDLHKLNIESIQMAASAFVLRQIYKDMFTWGTANRLRLAIVLDEAHRLAKDVTLLKLMKEGRKYGISVIVASQGMKDFDPEVLGNAGTKVIFRTNYPDSSKLANFIRPRRGGEELAEQIEGLQTGQAFVQTPEMVQGILTEMR
jgi:DNA phosphorothioation-dependent restriction protein DptH